MQFELTKQEAETLLQLLDVATKAGGLQVAKAASHYADKIVAASQAEEQPPEPEQELEANG